MMKAWVDSWRGAKEMELWEAILPDTSQEGALEQAEATAKAALEYSAKLAALLVKKGLISLDEATDTFDVFEKIRITENDF
jgi:polyhydroxyalkanoate synthesis regulator phasin